MITIPDPQNMPELSSPSLPQAIRFFTPKQKSVLAFSGVVFLAVLAVSGAVFYFWLTSFKKSLVDFSIAGPNQIASGENGTYIISYWNNTNQILKNSALNIRYPQGAIIDGGKNTNIDLGSIGIGGGGKQEIKIAFIGADKSIQKLEAALSYQPQNTSSTFENETAKISILSVTKIIRTRFFKMSPLRQIFLRTSPLFLRIGRRQKIIAGF